MSQACGDWWGVVPDIGTIAYSRQLAIAAQGVTL